MKLVNFKLDMNKLLIDYYFAYENKKKYGIKLNCLIPYFCENQD